ncbi:hypothetical protein BDW75DRAFT_79674 [Aspergillus navahoensis]
MRPLLSRLSLPLLPPWLLLLLRLMPLLLQLRLLPPLSRRKGERAISSHHNRRTAIFPHFTSFPLYRTYLLGWIHLCVFVHILRPFCFISRHMLYLIPLMYTADKSFTNT